MSRNSRSVLTSVVLLAVFALWASAPAGAVTISPLPGTPTAMPQTQISFLGAPASSLSAITVVGTRSGRHSGRLRSYSAATGASFVPAKAFIPGESVTVRARYRSGHRSRTLSTNFQVATPMAPPNGTFPSAPGTAADVQRFESQPEVHPPVVTVHQQASSSSAAGYVFGAPFFGPGQWGPMITDSAGNLVWFKAVGAGEDAADFRTQVYKGRNDLTWWQGHTIILGYGLGEGVIADANYRTVAVVRAGNGMPTDEHEFTVLPNGAALVLGYVPVQANLSSAGGPASGIAVDCAVQEVDIHTGLVMWEWRSLGHVDVSQSYSKVPTSPSGFYDYFHVNSAQVLPEGNVVISARNTWSIYDLSVADGHTIWQLGGKTSTFNLGPGVAFAYQHNALVSGNEVSLFDDEGAPPVKPPSRGEVVKLDTANHTATLVRQLVRAPTPLITGSQGDTQALPGGGYMIGWGGLPNFTEFDSQGRVVYDAQYPAGEFSYRVYRLPWAGQPLTHPAIAARSNAAGTTVFASWNGATTVDSWQLLAGSSPGHLKALSTTPRSGFETPIPAPGAAYYQVRALSASGRVLATSAAVKPVTG
jgi:hypothetical protein